MIWIAATIVASAVQTARNAMQSSLTASLGTLGATQVRFLYGLPFAVLFLSLIATLTHATIPPPNLRFLAFTIAAALAQIAATALLLASIRARSFSVAIAFSKTEAVQVSVFGLLVLADPLSPWRTAGALLAVIGVVLVAARKGDAWDRRTLAPILYGVLSGSLYALAAVGFRGAILSLGGVGFLISSSTALVWSLMLQSAMLGAWLAAFDRRVFVESFKRWRPSLFAGFAGALASQCWFIGFSLTSAANVRTLGLVEVLFAQIVGRRILLQRTGARELVGMVLIVSGVAFSLATFH